MQRTHGNPDSGRDRLHEGFAYIHSQHAGKRARGRRASRRLPYEESIFNDSGDPVPAGQQGHLPVRGLGTARFYWNRAERASETMLGKNWQRTRDTSIAGGRTTYSRMPETGYPLQVRYWIKGPARHDESHEKRQSHCCPLPFPSALCALGLYLADPLSVRNQPHQARADKDERGRFRDGIGSRDTNRRVSPAGINPRVP